MEPEEFKKLSEYLAIQPEELKNLSEKLSEYLKQDTNFRTSPPPSILEAAVRTAFSRYYYYIFLRLRKEILDAIENTLSALNADEDSDKEYIDRLNALKEILTPTPPNQKKKHKENEHQVIQRFITEFVGKKVGEPLFRLRLLRNIADYYLDTPIEVIIKGGRRPIKLELKFTPEEVQLIKRDIKIIEDWLEHEKYPIHKVLRSKDASEKISNVI